MVKETQFSEAGERTTVPFTLMIRSLRLRSLYKRGGHPPSAHRAVQPADRLYAQHTNMWKRMTKCHESNQQQAIETKLRPLTSFYDVPLCRP